ncbi:HET-domain-containing protein, partial [Pyrenochaeta sp. DS3sAY3a]
MKGLSLSQAASPVLWIEKFNHGAQNDPHHYLLPSEGVQDTFSGRPVGDTIEWKGIHEWLEFCDKTHGDECHQPTTENNLRLSFIDCSSGIVIHNEPATSYVTLSYMWADADHDSSSPDYTLPQDLPRVIDDAITVTKNLGFRYLWVDRYCIPQSSNPTLKQEIIERMGDIYSMSSLTIISAAKNALSRGLPGVRARCRDTIPCIRLGGHEFAPIFTSYDKEIPSSAWNKRGWTFQEERLSPRKLVFANSQIYFQCRKMHCFEALKTPLAVLHRQPERSYIRGYFAKENAAMMFPRVFSINTNDKDELWQSITAFNTRQFSYPTDAFNAFRGVLAQFSKFSTPTLHLCGHAIRPAGSASDFLQSLTW